MAGLMAAYEPKRAGHDPIILEARGRVGGRVYTLREPFAPGLYLRRNRIRLSELLARPDSFGFEVKGDERGKTPAQLWATTVAPLIAMLEAEGTAAWTEILRKWDRYSTRQFLELNGWAEAAIEMFGLIETQEARLA